MTTTVGIGTRSWIAALAIAAAASSGHAGPPPSAPGGIAAVAPITGGVWIAGGYNCDEAGAHSYLARVDATTAPATAAVMIGARWSDPAVPPFANALAASGSALIVAGTRLTRSTDGGVHWSDIPWSDVGGTAQIAAFAVADGVVVAVGADGVALRSTDDGATWTETETPAGVRLFAVAGSAGSFVAVGEYGTVIASADGGQTWKLERSGTRHGLRSVAITAERAIAIDDHGRMLARKTDGRWRRQRVVGAPFQLVWAVDHDVYALGARPIASTDGGATWTALAGLPAHPQQFAALAADDVYLAGYDGVIHRSLDHGATWQDVYAVAEYKCR